MQGLAEWLAAFREAHEKARRGALGAGDLAAYRSGRDELARALLVGQQLTLAAGQTPRQTLRVARALQIELVVAEVHERTVTLDLSTGGFSAALSKAPPLGDEVGVTLRLPATDPLACRARVTDVRAMGGQARVSARFTGLPASERERLEVFVFDTVLALIGR
ncbi:MAG: PilZ domain-containing protein [Anaeromyxobacter sp.]|nr:PilZ domain-containing protein [Anaeromyxobacter sp.]MBL0278029.1 PilZ domain-containing protein [Anaeromyxobacter sp.]